MGSTRNTSGVARIGSISARDTGTVIIIIIIANTAIFFVTVSAGFSTATVNI
ncbi:unnamed protein product, partial [marine sediment metagenome]